MRVTVTHTLHDLSDDFRTIARRVRPDMRKVIRDSLDLGNQIARGNAERTAGEHGKLYPKAFSVEMTGALAGEYGPVSAMPQGGMSFEGGSRNQPPHNDIAKSFDLITYPFRESVGRTLDGWFWP